MLCIVYTYPLGIKFDEIGCVLSIHFRVVHRIHRSVHHFFHYQHGILQGAFYKGVGEDARPDHWLVLLGGLDGFGQDGR